MASFCKLLQHSLKKVILYGTVQTCVCVQTCNHHHSELSITVHDKDFSTEYSIYTFLLYNPPTIYCTFTNRTSLPKQVNHKSHLPIPFIPADPLHKHCILNFFIGSVTLCILDSQCRFISASWRLVAAIYLMKLKSRIIQRREKVVNSLLLSDI